MNDCQKIQEMISAMLDGEISASQREAIEQHIAACPECAAMYADFAALGGMFEESREEVPAALHTKIMKGVRTSQKPKKPLIIQLRPYMSAAACLIIAVAAVFAMGDSRKSADSMSAPMVAEAPAAPAAYAKDASPAESFMEDDAVFGYGTMETEAAEPQMPLPAPAEPAAPAEPVLPEAPSGSDLSGKNTVTVTADRDTVLSEFEAYIPGTAIDEAWMVFYHDSGIVEYRPLAEPAELAKLLAENDGKINPGALPEKADVFLRIYVGGVQQPVKLYFTDKGVIAETAAGFYAAEGSAEDFAALAAKNFSPEK